MITVEPAGNNWSAGSSPQPTAATSRLLSQLSGRYVVDRQLGHGGMGSVYLARDAKLGRPVAIKVLHPEITDRIDPQRFLGEIRLTAGLQHPHILPVLDSDCRDGVLYYITPYLSEGSLHSLLRSEGRISLRRAVCIALDVLEALDYAHNQGVVHRDIKPENILLSHGHAVLADFGIATTMTAMSRRDPDEVWGSPAYMSPEQAGGAGDIDGRSDLYSLGCVLYEMLTGSPIFTGSTTLAVVAKKFSDPVPQLSTEQSDIPHSVAAAVARSLAVDPNQRFRAARSFALALTRGLQEPRPASPPGPEDHGVRPRIAKWLRTAMLAATLLTVG
ncbi:MAG: serine/threonine protein kinase [Gemmatimonadota bacterium]|nr:MAG: serine/threonine protein kinase [Gemmatimonadota bacterium]